MSRPFSYQESQQRGAVAALIGRCEKITGLGCLPEAEERRLRELIVETCAAFDMPTISERPDAIESFRDLGGKFIWENA